MTTRTTVRSSSVRTVRRTNPRGGAVILTAERGRTVLRYDGRNFSSKGRAKRFSSITSAYRRGEHLLRNYPVLRGYRLYVRHP